MRSLGETRAGGPQRRPRRRSRSSFPGAASASGCARLCATRRPACSPDATRRTRTPGCDGANPRSLGMSATRSSSSAQVDAHERVGVARPDRARVERRELADARPRLLRVLVERAVRNARRALPARSAGRACRACRSRARAGRTPARGRSCPGAWPGKCFDLEARPPRRPRTACPRSSRARRPRACRNAASRSARTPAPAWRSRSSARRRRPRRPRPRPDGRRRARRDAGAAPRWSA